MRSEPGRAFALSLWVLFHRSMERFEEEAKKEVKIRNAELVELIAKKISHNIRSPLAVLRALFVDGAVDLKSFMDQAERAVIRMTSPKFGQMPKALAGIARVSWRPIIRGGR